MTEDGGRRAALHTALAKAQGEFPTIPRNKTVTVRTRDGRNYTFAYAPLDTILEKVRPVLAANGLAVTQCFNDEALMTRLLHADGWSIDSSLTVQRAGGSWQEFGSAITYARRYALVALLGIASEEDDDANGASGNVTEATKPKAEGPKPITAAQRRRLFALAKENEVHHDRLKEIIRTVTGNESSDSITSANYDEVVVLVEAESIPFE